jgi:predicted nuclease with TOPRIM domain
MNADAGLDAIESRLDRLEAGQAELKAGQAELKAGQTDLRAELKHEMHVLHEDVIDRIKALPTDVPSRAEMRQAFAEQDERIARRLDPLEAALRQLIRERRRS